VNETADEIAHGTRWNEQTGLETKHGGKTLLELLDCRVIAQYIICYMVK
jgi:hypothetical protein